MHELNMKFPDDVYNLLHDLAEPGHLIETLVLQIVALRLDCNLSKGGPKFAPPFATSLFEYQSDEIFRMAIREPVHLQDHKGRQFTIISTEEFERLSPPKPRTDNA